MPQRLRMSSPNGDSELDLQPPASCLRQSLKIWKMSKILFASNFSSTLPGRLIYPINVTRREFRRETSAALPKSSTWLRSVNYRNSTSRPGVVPVPGNPGPAQVKYMLHTNHFRLISVSNTLDLLSVSGYRNHISQCNRSP